MVAKILAPLLKKDGFRKNSKTWWRDCDSVIEVIDLQKSQWNDANEAKFAINLGLYWPSIHKAIKREAGDYPPKTWECTVQQRLGPLFSEGKDFWWKVTEDTDLDTIGDEICNKLSRSGYEWLREGHDLEKTLLYAQSQSRTIVEREITAQLEIQVEQIAAADRL